MGQAQINVRTRACSRTSIARTRQAALTHNVRGKELILYIFFDCKLLYLYVLCHDVLLPLTMSIVYLFVSVLLLYQSVIKIDVPNKWASACVQPAIDDGR